VFKTRTRVLKLNTVQLKIFSGIGLFVETRHGASLHCVPDKGSGFI